MYTQMDHSEAVSEDKLLLRCVFSNYCPFSITITILLNNFYITLRISPLFQSWREHLVVTIVQDRKILLGTWTTWTSYTNTRFIFSLFYWKWIRHRVRFSYSRAFCNFPIMLQHFSKYKHVIFSFNQSHNRLTIIMVSFTKKLCVYSNQFRIKHILIQ